MEVEKRKREDDGEANGKRENKLKGDNDVKIEVPGDEEVEEFFAILRRIQVAYKYFQKRNGLELTATPWSPSFVMEDFGGVKKEPERNPHPGLDLNSDPTSDEPDNASDSV